MEVHMLMSSRIVMSSVVALGFAAALHAQTPTSQEANRAIPGEITVTGCVERADQMAAATAGTTVDSLSFMLIHAVKGTAAQAQPIGTSGTKDDVSGSAYHLDAEVTTLNPHVGHKV